MMELLETLFRWLHVIAGIVWIGLLYFFNWVNAPLQPTLDGPTKQKVVPELMPRALYWFRWGAAWTWVTGVLLLLLVFYHGGAVFAPGQGWGLGAILMILVTFLAVLAYDALFKSGLGKDLKVAAAIGLAITVVIIVLFQTLGGFGYRGYVIHTGAMFGTIMAFNVWMRIWPAQQRIISAVKQGGTPDPADAAMAGGRSKHNTYLSVPLVWMMLNQHTSVPWASSTVWLVVFIVAGWGLAYLLYNKAAQVKGF